MKNLLVLAVSYSLLLATCPPKPPTPPTPTPTPSPSPDARPTAPVYTNLLLRQTAGNLVHPDGTPYRVVGSISCWPICDDGCLKVASKPVPYLWSLVSPEYEDATKPFGVNAYHVRLGPWLAVDSCCGNQDVGGAYTEPLNGTWNIPFWQRVHRGIDHAGKIGSLVEVNGLDTWLLKKAINREMGMPWPAADIASAMSVPLNASVVGFVNKFTYETCNYAHIVYLIGNESSGVPGWTTAWERAMYAAIRAGEQQAGCGHVVHMIGSNSPDLDGPYDYFAQHDGVLVSPIAGRPMWMNEYNLHKTCASFKAMCDSALAQGTACWYWRSDGSDADQDCSLNSINSGPVNACPDPLPDRTKLTFAINCNPANGICDTTPLTFSNLSYCQAIGMGTIGGQPRASCPMRNECGPSGQPNPADQDPANPGPSFQCNQRLNCEQYAMQAPAPVLSSDGTINLLDAAGFRFTCNGCTWVQACDKPGAACAKVPYP